MDISEGFPHDEALLEFATSANVCCGEHAGSKELTEQTISICQAKGKRIGMHPGYPDREGMGRRTLLPNNKLLWEWSLVEQSDWFLTICEPKYVKPHGAFYNDTAFPMDYFELPPPGKVSRGSSWVEPEFPRDRFVDVLPSGKPLLSLLSKTHALLGLPGTMHENAARKANAVFIREGFADRAYQPNGLLVFRSEPGAILEDPDQIKHQVLELAPKVDSICLHVDKTIPHCICASARNGQLLAHNLAKS